MKTLDSNQTRDILIKADLYRILSLAFEIPDQELIDSLSDIIREAVDSSILEQQYAEILKNTFTCLEKNSDLESEYHRIFTTQSGIPFSEASYSVIDKGNLIGDVAAFYKAFSFEVQSQTGSPDSIKMELGFLSFLSILEYQAILDGNEENTEIVQDARRKFLQEHAFHWFQEFINKLMEYTTHPFYTSVAFLFQKTMELESNLVAQ